MHDDFVARKRWISNEDFFHALSHCMILPGPEAQQLAIYIGWKLHGIKGGFLAGTLFVLPSMFVLLVLSIAYARFGNLPWISALFGGLKPAVLALLILALVRLASRSLATPIQWAVALGAFIAVIWLHASIPLVMLAAIVIGLARARSRPSVAGSTPSILDPEGSKANSAAQRRASPAVIEDHHGGIVDLAHAVAGSVCARPGDRFLEATCPVLHAKCVRYGRRLLHSNSIRSARSCDEVLLAESL